MAKTFYRSAGKRALDLLISVPLVLVLSPILLVAALAVRLTSPGPVVFRQARLGRDGRIFQIFKLRTMTHTSGERRAQTEVTESDPELTSVGRLLRRYKIDELPQLGNVILGDMSLVGPRPPLPRQLEEYDETSKRRLLVRPGLTGLAQVNGNISLSWQERWRYDVEYVDRLSLLLDTAILARTVRLVLTGADTRAWDET